MGRTVGVQWGSITDPALRQRYKQHLQPGEETPIESGSLLVNPGVIKGHKANARKEKRSVVVAEEHM